MPVLQLVEARRFWGAGVRRCRRYFCSGSTLSNTQVPPIAGQEAVSDPSDTERRDHGAERALSRGGTSSSRSATERAGWLCARVLSDRTSGELSWSGATRRLTLGVLGADRQLLTAVIPGNSSHLLVGAG